MVLLSQSPALEQSVERSIGTEVIGYSTEGRPLQVQFIGSGSQEAKSSTPRVLIIAGQHGDEPLARQGVEKLLSATWNQHELQVAILLDANPDGSSRGVRQNSSGIDLNRDHQRLAAPETQAIHHFGRAWKPDLVIDVHTYPPRRKVMIQQGIVYQQDVQLDVANNVSIPHQTLKAGEDLLRHLLTEMSHDAYEVGRYTLFRQDGRVRHSTPDLVDARNGLSLRLGVPGLLIEGRQPSRRDNRDRTNDTVEAISAALQCSLAWSKSNLGGPEKASFRNSEAGSRVAIRSKLGRCAQVAEMKMADPKTGEPKLFQLREGYTPNVIATKQVSMPFAYAIPAVCSEVIELMERHGFSSIALSNGMAEKYTLDQVTHESSRAGKQKRNTSRWVKQAKEMIDLRDYRVYATGEDGHALAAHLEPRAKYNLTRCLPKGAINEILRIS